MLIVHGTDDEKLEVQFARDAKERLARFSIALSYREMRMRHEITRESLDVVTAWLTAQLNACPGE